MTRTNSELVDFAREVLTAVSFGGFGNPYTFLVSESHGGVHLRASYQEADIYPPHEVQEQLTRKWLLHPEMTESEIVFTAFKCVMTSVEHRTRETFQFEGALVCGPHFDVRDLVLLCKSGRENAGGRTADKKP